MQPTELNHSGNLCENGQAYQEEIPSLYVRRSLQQLHIQIHLLTCGR